MARVNITKSKLRGIAPAPKGKRKEVMDVVVPGFGIRVNDKPRVPWLVEGPDGEEREIIVPQGSYIFRAPAQPGAPAQRWVIGPFPGIGIAAARDEAGRIRAQLIARKDPRQEQQAKRQAEAAQAALTFGVAAEEYLKLVDRQRRGESTRADFERDLLPYFRDIPLRQISKQEIRTRIKEIAEGKNRGELVGKKKSRPRGASPRQAKAALTSLKTFFAWAEGEYDLESVPTESRGLNKLLPAAKPRQRVLSDPEIVAYWRAAGEENDPLRSGYKLLLLTGARLNEVFEARKREIGENGTLLTIPPERFKSDAEHLIPLSPLAQKIIADMDTIKGSKFLLSRDGKKPAQPWTKDRERLHARMEALLKKAAAERGDDPDDVELKPFVLHDVRRTVRTRLSALRVDEAVAEMVIGHDKQGLQRTYNLHRYKPEMREALERWADFLKGLVEPPPAAPVADNVVRLTRKALAG